MSVSEKWLDSLVNNEEECMTPKSEEHKIPPVLCCPIGVQLRSCKDQSSPAFEEKT